MMLLIHQGFGILREHFVPHYAFSYISLTSEGDIFFQHVREWIMTPLGIIWKNDSRREDRLV
jgi:hypothetical protein